MPFSKQSEIWCYDPITKQRKSGTGRQIQVAGTQSEFNFDNSFAKELEGFYVPIKGHDAPKPELVRLNESLAAELQLDAEFLSSDAGVEILSGKQAPEGAYPLAQAYAGHQFGGFSPSLGDGRAMLLGEVIDLDGVRRDIQLKGSGRTPFSRNGDGKAALGPVLREYIVSEAMHALGVPTTRSLAAVTTGEQVYREVPLPGAVLTRIASSHLRIGTFQFFAARNDEAKVKQLADYAINRHYPSLNEHPDKYLEFLKAVISVQASLVAQWMAIGFVHGVMNTDNMTISGETIDYGPCAFIDVFTENAVFSSIDETGRYAYRMQPLILQWNLARLAECLLGLIDNEDKDNAVRVATNELNVVPEIYKKQWLERMGAKIGLKEPVAEDNKLIENLLKVMEDGRADFTNTFRALAMAVEKNDQPFLEQFSESTVNPAKDWLADWRSRTRQETVSDDDRIEQMKQANPHYIPRNHLVEEAIREAVSSNNLEPFTSLMTVLEKPFDEQDGTEKYTRGAPADSGPYITFCGT